MKKIVVFFSVATFLFFLPLLTSAETKTGLITTEEGTYYYIDGVKQTGFQIIDGKTYFFSRIGNNEMRTGMFNIDGVGYYFNEEGIMQTGWYNDGTNTYYFDEDGKRASGFKKIEDNTYFFSRIGNNEMRTGMFNIDGVGYYFNEEGMMQTGWYNDGTNTYYFDEDGKRVSGFKKIEGNTYFFSRINNNEMRTGVILIDGDSYAFNEEGIMQTGWYQDATDTYYFDENGKGLTGFQTINYKKYFFSRINKHEMRTGVILIDGDSYAFDEDGIMQTGWYKDGTNTYYFYSSGKGAVDFVDIDGSTYFFSRLGLHEMRTGQVYVDGNLCYLAADGKLEKIQYIPTYYMQRDARWKDIRYGFSTMGGTGCAPTSMAMAFQSILRRQVLPTEVADFLYYHTNEFNKYTSGSSGMAIIYATSYFGIDIRGVSSLEELNKALEDGKIVFAAMANGKFATPKWNHAIVLYNYSNGNTIALDPLNTANNGWISTAQVWNERSLDPDDLRGGASFYILG